MSTATQIAAPVSIETPRVGTTPASPAATDVRQRLIGYLLHHKNTLIMGLACGALAALVEGSTLVLLKKYIENLGRPGTGRFLLLICLSVILLYAIMGLLKYGQSVLLATSAQRLGNDVRSDTYSHLQQFSLEFFHTRRTGSLMSTLQVDVSKLQNAAMLLKDAIIAPINALVFLGFLFHLSWQLTLFLILTVPLMAVAIQRLTRHLRSISLATQDRLADLSAVMEETLAAPRIVRAFTAEAREIARFQRASEYAMNMQLKGIRRSSRLGPTIDLIGAVGVAAVLFIGGTLALHKQMDAAALITYLLASSKIANNVNAIGGLKSGYEEMLGAADRIFTGVLDLRPTVIDAPDARILSPIQGRIAFENVSFAYTPDKPVLRDIDLTIEPGEVVAFVGETGAGKSTLADLVPRFYDPTGGRITVDGYDLRDVTLHSLRSQLGIVPQENILFSGTIRENLTYGRPEASDEEVRAAARATNIAEFVDSMPDGYETRVGERGSTLSGGQRQRIAIARALLADPRILILDEATSALDAKTEALVQGALETLMKGRTTIIIAHRLSTIANADKIVVLSQGRIVETGTHRELLAHDGIYARLYATQQRQAEETTT